MLSKNIIIPILPRKHKYISIENHNFSVDLFFFSCFGFNENKHKSLVWLRIIGCWGRVIYTEQKHTTHVPQQLPHRTRPSMQQYIWRWLINNSQNHCIPRWIYPVTTWCTNTSSSTKFNHWPRRWAEHIVVDTCFHVHVHVAFQIFNWMLFIYAWTD